MKEQQAQPTSNSRSRGKLGALALACFQLPGPSEVRPDQVRRGGVLRRPFVNSSAPLSTFLLLALILTPFRAAAMTGIEQEENISDLLPVTFPSEESARDPATRSWAILPQVGYGPDTGFLGGVKFVERDLFDSGTSLDLGGFYATER